MSKPATTRSDAEVFDTMGIFEMADSTRSSMSIRLQFAKFAHGFTIADFESFIESVGMENVVSLGRLSFPNEWQMTLSSHETREKLIRSGRVRINNRSCWIHPLSSAEIRGHVHWLPNEIPHFQVKEILKNFGDVLFIETLDYSKFNYTIASDARYFALYLKLGACKEDLPHFITVSHKRALITIRGRPPACFHCCQVGHRKSECKIYRERLGEYCMKPSGSSGRRGKRGLRHKPFDSSGSENIEISAADSNKSANEVQTSMQNVNEAGIGSETKQEISRNKNKKKARRKKKNAKKENPPTAVDATAEVSKDAQSKENELALLDNSKTNTQIPSSSSNISTSQTSQNLSSTVECVTKSCNEDGNNLNFNHDDTNMPSALESKNPLLEEEKVVLVNDQDEALFVESTIQNPCDHFNELPNDNVVKKNFSVSSQNPSRELVDEKSISVSNCDIIAENSDESVLFKNCLDKNFKNVCNDLVNDSSVDSVRNNTQQVSELMQEYINNQISDIANNFILQITDVLSEANIGNISEIKNKLLEIHGTLMCSKNSDSEAKSNLIQHDKNSNIINSSDMPKTSKKKKKKSKKIQE